MLRAVITVHTTVASDTLCETVNYVGGVIIVLIAIVTYLYKSDKHTAVYSVLM